MNAVFDQGNTFLKIGLFEKGDLVDKASFTTWEEGLDWLKNVKVSHAIYASVGKDLPDGALEKLPVKTREKSFWLVNFPSPSIHV